MPNPWMLMNQPQQFGPQDLIVQPMPEAPAAPEFPVNPMPQTLINKQNQSDILNELEKSYLESIEGQRAQIENTRKQLESARQSTDRLDLTPLAALVDTWTGSNIAPYYTAPASKEKIQSQLEQALLKAQGNLSETQRQAIKDRMYAQNQLEQIAASKEARLAARDQQKKDKEDKQDLSIKKYQRESEKEYTKTYGEPLRNLALFAGKVSALEKKLIETGDPFSGASSAEIDALSSSINTDYNRDIAQLGALAGADLNLIKSATGQGLGVQEYVMRQLKGGPQSRINLLRMLKSDVEKRAAAYKNEVMSNSDYEVVARRLDNDLNAINKATNPGKTKNFTPEQINKMTDEEVRANYNSLYGGG